MSDFIQTENMVVRTSTINRLERLSPRGTRIQLENGRYIDVSDKFDNLSKQLLEGKAE